MEETFTYDNMDRLTGIDLTRSAGQGGDSLRYSYGFDRQRMRVEEFSTGWSRTKDYVGRCEFVTENGASGTDSRSLTFVTGPCGVFAVVEDDGQTQSVHYVLKDNLGSWSVVTDGDGNVEQSLSYDAWGNPLRFIDPTGYYVTYGGGHKPDGPLQQVVMDGHVGFVLPEVTVTAYENPINHFEFTYEPNNSGGSSGGYLSYGLNSNNPTIGSSGGGGGGNGAGHSGVVTTPTDPITVPPPIGNNGILLQNFWDGAITTNTYLNGVTTIFGKGAEWGQLVSEGVKETEAALMLGKVANGAKFFGAAGLLLNWGCLGIQVELNQIPLQEGVVRGVMSGIELGLTFVPYVGPILSIGLTAFDIGGGFDNN